LLAVLSLVVLSFVDLAVVLRSLLDCLDCRAEVTGFGVAGGSTAAGWTGAGDASLFVSVVVVLAAGSAGFELEQAAINEPKSAKAVRFRIRWYMFPPLENTLTLSQTDSTSRRYKKKYISRQ